MAKNFLDQALSLIGLKSPTANDYYDPSAYRTEVINSEVFNAASDFKINQQQTKLTPSTAKQTSGVEKYLEAKQQQDNDIITEQTTESTAKLSTKPAPVEKLTGVAKYLFTKQQEEQAALSNMTGVEKYLYSQKNHKIIPVTNTAPEKISNPVKLSSVDKYLAKQQEPAGRKQTDKVAKKPVKELAKTSAKIKETKTKVIQKEKPAHTSKKINNKIIDLSVAATQCQAATLKRAQCSRKTSLETIEISINKQRYKFTVCSQHNKDSFIPFEKFLQDD